MESLAHSNSSSEYFKEESIPLISWDNETKSK